MHKSEGTSLRAANVPRQWLVAWRLPGCRRPSSCRFLNRHGIGQTCRWLSLHQDWHNLRQPLDPNGRCNWAIDTPCTAMQARAPTQSQGSATSRSHCFAKVRGPIARWPGLHFGGFGLGSCSRHRAWSWISPVEFSGLRLW